MTKRQQRIDPMGRLRDNAFQLFRGARELVQQSEAVETGIKKAIADNEAVVSAIEATMPGAESAIIRLAEIQSGLLMAAENQEDLSKAFSEVTAAEFGMITETLSSLVRRSAQATTQLGQAIMNLRMVEEYPRAVQDRLREVLGAQQKITHDLEEQVETEVDQTSVLANMDVLGGLDPEFILALLINAAEKPVNRAVDQLSENQLGMWLKAMTKPQNMKRLTNADLQAVFDNVLDAQEE